MPKIPWSDRDSEGQLYSKGVEVRLASDPRPTFSTSRQSDILAVELLTAAKEQGKAAEKGEPVTVEITGVHLDVHYKELMMSLSQYAERYGLSVGHIFDNVLGFYKM